MSNRIQVLQNKAVRAVYRLPYNEHKNLYFKSNNILKLQDLYNLYIHRRSYIYSYIKIRGCINFSRIYSHSNLHNHSTRNRNNFVLPHFYKWKYQSSFLYQSFKQWNILPAHVKSSHTLFTIAAFIDFEWVAQNLSIFEWIYLFIFL